MTCKDCFHYAACDNILFWNTDPRIYRDFRRNPKEAAAECEHFLNKKKVVIVESEAAKKEAD